MSRVVLLGPQRLAPFVGSELRRCNIQGPVAMITAGWQEREGEDEELRAELGVPAVNLRLYERWDDIRANDRPYFDAHRTRQDTLRRLRELYQRRLKHAVAQLREMFDSELPEALIEPERRDAVAALQALDSHHLRRTHEINEEFEWTWQPGSRPAVARHRAEVADQLLHCESVAIAGGHIAVLLNRLRLFALAPLLRRKVVFAWAAGAMALTERVFLFHDSPPQGVGSAEMFEVGLGLVPRLVVLPHARHRLHLHDATRVAIMARRLAPARCVPLDERERLEWYNGDLLPTHGLRRLHSDGRILTFDGDAP